MMTQEKEAVDEGTGGGAAQQTGRTGGSVKLSQGLLTFRSQKLLRSSLSKRGDTKNVEKPAAALLSTTEISGLERNKTSSEEPRGAPTKGSRTLVDPKIESDSAKASTRSSARQSHKTERISPLKDERLNDGSVQSDAFGEAPSTRQLSSKLKLFETFYEGLEAACSLLRIRKQMCTFRAVCKIVESMSKRRFLLKHLAQIKHIFSEVMLLEYVRCQDPDSWGERWDLRINLLSLPSDCPHTGSPLKGSAGQTAQTVRRRKEFRARLLSFANSHPEDGDIPLEQLPRRPSGVDPLQASNTQRAASPPRDQVSVSHLRAQGGNSEASPQTANAESAIHSGTEGLQFSIVKPSRGNDTVPVAGTPHFLASFRPFYSNIQTTERVAQPPATLPHESHFPASFRPSFSIRPPSEATSGLPGQLPKKLLPNESLFRGSCCEDKDVDCGVEARIGSRDGVPCSVSVNSPSPSDNSVHVPPSTPLPSAKSEKQQSSSIDKSCHFTPSTPVPSCCSRELPSSSTDEAFNFPPSTPVPSANTKELPSTSAGKSCPQSQHFAFPASPVPIHTPPFLSPMNGIFSSSKDTSNQTHSKTPVTTSLRGTLPPKGQGSMRSLRFGSPVRATPQVKGEDSETPRRTRSLSSAVSSSPTDAISARLVHTPVSTPCTPNPETPNLQTPVRNTLSKEAWYSPPKRIKLRASLFTDDGEKAQELCIAGPSVSGARESCQEAVGGGTLGEDFSKSSQREAAKALMPHPTAKDSLSITESDLDVIQCLPLDIVQSVWEKERKMKDSSSRELANQKRRQQMMSGVPKLFNQLRLIFQSLNRTVLPEHELIKTILTSHPEITDKAEVEERLKLVIELAPDYINIRPSHSGELLYRVDKRADVVKIQRRISGSLN